jgi:hypothetical protein
VVDCVEVDRVSLNEQITGKPEERLGGVLVADKRGKVLDFRRCLLADALQNLSDGTFEGRVRANLDDDV